jgi:hypothetical protein
MRLGSGGDMNADRKVVSLKRCIVCGEPHVRAGTTCSRMCLMVWAEFNDFTVLQSVLINARWAEAPSQAEMARRYYRQQMSEAVGELARSEDALT